MARLHFSYHFFYYRWRQCAVSSSNSITTVFLISKAFLHHQDKRCIFKHVLTDFIQFPSPTHTVTLLVYKGIYVWYSKVETMQHWSWILYAHLCFLCHVIEDKCWKHSFKQSMRLKCTARKECIKYININIYRYICEELCSKMYTPHRNNVTQILQIMLTVKIQSGKVNTVKSCYWKSFLIIDLFFEGTVIKIYFHVDVLEWNSSIFHSMTCSTLTLCVSLPVFGFVQ